MFDIDYFRNIQDYCPLVPVRLFLHCSSQEYSTIPEVFRDLLLTNCLFHQSFFFSRWVTLLHICLQVYWDMPEKRTFFHCPISVNNVSILRPSSILPVGFCAPELQLALGKN